MDKEKMENLVKFFTEVQECNDKRTAFLKGALFGLGFVDFPEPGWEIIKKMIKEGEDRIGWLCIEKETFDINKKLKKDQIKLIMSLVMDILPDGENQKGG